jgi:hypothetical protein
MFQLFLDALKAFWDWFIDIIISLGATVAGWILSAIPDGAVGHLAGAWNSCMVGISAANEWAPISEALQFAVAYVSFVIAYLLIKILIKMIP